jgi:hypothetical protein
MKIISFSFVFFFFVGVQASAQNAVSFYLLSSTPVGAEITAENALRLNERLKTVNASNSSAEAAPISIFAFRPTLEATEFGKIEGIKTKVTCQLTLSLTVQNLLTKVTFGATSLVLTGVGDDKKGAIAQAITTVKPSNPQLKKCWAAAQAEVTAYYTKQCATILETAKQQLEQLNFGEAVIAVASVPETATCYKEAQELKKEALKKWQENNCKNQLQKADLLVTNNQFDEAIGALSLIDANSPCADEVKRRIAELEPKIDAKEKERFDWFFQVYATGAAFEKAQNNLLSSLLKSYFAGTQHYDFVE